MDVCQRKGPAPPSKKKRRRPPNGFLGFCSRHRPLVASRNTHLENRLVTKVLGSWWKLLKPDDKNIYETQAKVFKDVFMLANPDFKWYSRAESTGNTPVTRQSKRLGAKLDSGGTAKSGAFNPGKLADISQMGQLSALMDPAASQPKNKSTIAIEHDYLDGSEFTNNNNNNNNTDVGSKYMKCCDPRQEAEIEEIDEIMAHEDATEWENEEDNDDDEIRFKEFMELCPIFSYDDFLKLKAEKNAPSNKRLQNKKKWAKAKADYMNEDKNKNEGEVTQTLFSVDTCQKKDTDQVALPPKKRWDSYPIATPTVSCAKRSKREAASEFLNEGEMTKESISMDMCDKNGDVKIMLLPEKRLNSCTDATRPVTPSKMNKWEVALLEYVNEDRTKSHGGMSMESSLDMSKRQNGRKKKALRPKKLPSPNSDASSSFNPEEHAVESPVSNNLGLLAAAAQIIDDRHQ